MSNNLITVKVSGLTCNNCVGHVTEELNELAQVSEVNVDLVSGGVSTVSITSEAELSDAEIHEAIAEAGGYTITDIIR
ncbi:MAG: heavy-metal-associated domain-containing protein [Arcanobacterium sp.]|nr:heavy-metal-associated domain-containing protein [Arcanobacterium sp.]